MFSKGLLDRESAKLNEWVFYQRYMRYRNSATLEFSTALWVYWNRFQ